MHGWNQHEITGDLAKNFGLNYDREKYKEMLLDAAETVLGIFGFDRTLYGKPKELYLYCLLHQPKKNDNPSARYECYRR